MASAAFRSSASSPRRVPTPNQHGGTAIRAIGQDQPPQPALHNLASCVAAPALLLADTDLRNQGWKDSRDAIQCGDHGTVSVDLPEGSSLEVAVRADC